MEFVAHKLTTINRGGLGLVVGESRHGPTDKMSLPAQARRPGSPRQTRSIPVDGRVDMSQMLVSANRLTDKLVCSNKDASEGRCD